MLTNSPILVVEDCDEDYDTLIHAFRKTGIKSDIYHASSGDECLAILHNKFSMNVVQPSLILLDLNMPGMDGRETLHAIKSDNTFKNIPVVVFTTSSNPRDITKCYEYGANAYHVKPIQYPDHIRILEAIFQYWVECVRSPGLSLQH
jgi:two-component system, response regulator